MPGCLALSALARFVLIGSLPALAGVLAGVVLTWIALARPLAAFVGRLTAATGLNRRGGVLGFFVLGHLVLLLFGLFRRGGITAGPRGGSDENRGKSRKNREFFCFWRLRARFFGVSA